MSHMVIYRGVDGKPGYHQTDDIHDAVGFVEQMRNEDGVEHARIFRLEEVVFEYRPYYRVELADGDRGHDVPVVADATGGALRLEAGPAEEAIDVRDVVVVDEQPIDDPAMAPEVEPTAEAPAGPNGAANGVPTETGPKKGLFGR